MKRVRTWELDEGGNKALDEWLRRPPLEEMPVPEAVLDRTEALFGERLTPAETVARIASDVREGGDGAVLRYAAQIDGATRLTADTLFVTDEEIRRAVEGLEPGLRDALEHAIRRVRRFHEAERRNSWFISEETGTLLGQRLIPLRRVGAYVPGGTAPLISSAYMNVVPAKVAGVRDVIVATPVGPTGRVDERILAAAALAGADRVLKVGGAQAIAALAYGTEHVPAVDKIVGPGNPFVQLAKKLVFGRVGIDSLAGPSEVLILADESADPAYIAADLLAQAEHSPDAGAVLLTTDERVADAVDDEIERQLSNLSRAEIARASLANFGGCLLCRTLDEAFEWLNRWAPEHAELLVADPWRWVDRVECAGALFLGPASAEVVGDYIAGTNHVLPTNGTARFASALGVDDFVRRSSLIAYAAETLEQTGEHAMKLAEGEGLTAHAAAVRVRMSGRGGA